MTKEELKQRLISIYEENHNLIMDHGVIYDSSIYAFMLMAENAIGYSIAHIDDYLEDILDQDDDYQEE